MRFLINAYMIAGGSIQVGNAVINGLRFHPEHEYYIICSEQVAQTLGNMKDYPGFMHFEVFPPPNLITNLFRLIHVNPRLDRCVREFSADAVFSIFGPSYWKPKVPHLCGFARPLYIYPDSPFFKNLSFFQRLKIKTYKRIHMRSFRNDCDMLVAENPDVSERLSVLCPHKKIVTVFSCCNPIFDTPEIQTTYELPPFEGISLLTIAVNFPHKNLQILPKTATYLKKAYPDFKFRFIVSLKEGEITVPDHLKECFVYVGKISIQNLPSFYEQVDFMILPTLLECFSASWIDAMKSSIPVLTSDLPFAHGICGKAAVYFNPEDPVDIGEKIVCLTHDKPRQKELIEQGKKQLSLFTDNSTRTSLYLSYLEELVKKKRSNRQ